MNLGKLVGLGAIGLMLVAAGCGGNDDDPSGPIGGTGDTGVAGEAGIDGTDAAAGTDGTVGTDAAAGTDGTVGTDAGTGNVLGAPEASRTSGVAPLSVHFWADIAESSAGNMPFHDYEYSWNFGDSTSGTWGTSGKSKNTDKGPVAAHVYETPGTYTATLTVRDHSGVVDAETFTITVQDPNTVYAGTNTTCISTTSDFTGCPAGAAQVTTTNLADLSNYTSANSRVLLRRGSSWGVTSSPSFPDNQGPVHIGAFGACSTPDELGICDNAPIVNINAGFRFIDFARKKDWRLTDITFEGSKIADSGLAVGTTDTKYHLISRVKASNLHNCISMSHWRNSDSQYDDHIFIHSSILEGTNSSVVYIGSERLAIIGNIIRNSDTTHVLRVWQGYKGVIGHNMISGSSLTNTAGRHALKFHGPNVHAVGPYAETGNGGLRYRTKFAVVSNNVFGSSGPWPISIGPQDHLSEENLSDIIFEKNRIIAGYGQSSERPPQRAFMFAGRYATVRNNIIDGTGSANGYTGIVIAQIEVEWTPLGNRVYNNTIYNPSSNSNGVTGIMIGASATDTVIRNNYVSFVGATGPKTLVNDNSGNAVMSNNVITDSHGFVDPNNSNSLSRDFRLTSSATLAIAQGYTTPLLDDFDGQYRATPYDLGAYIYGDPD